MTDKPQPTTTGQRIHQLRLEHEWLDAKDKKRKGLSKSQLARDLGVHRYTVINWEADKYLPHWANLQQLAEYFGVSVKYLLYGENNKGEKADEEKR